MTPAKYNCGSLNCAEPIKAGNLVTYFAGPKRMYHANGRCNKNPAVAMMLAAGEEAITGKMIMLPDRKSISIRSIDDIADTDFLH